MHASIQKLISTKMTRREFLTYVGVLLLSITGISGIMKSIANISVPGDLESANGVLKAEKGFGNGAYGV